MKTKKDFLKKCIALLLAVNLCGIGVALFIQANLGSDSITVIQEGISIKFGISLGSSSRLFNVLFLAVALLIAHEHIGWCTIAYALNVGSFIDIYNSLIASLAIGDRGVIIKSISVLLGQLCLIATYAILIKYREGMNQLDAISYGIEKYTKISYKHIRTTFDVAFIIIGGYLGGCIGIGSLFSMATTGYGVDMLLRAVDKKG